MACFCELFHDEQFLHMRVFTPFIHPEIKDGFLENPAFTDDFPIKTFIFRYF